MNYTKSQGSTAVQARAAQVTGEHHRHARQPGQDAAAFMVGHQWAVTVVSDGCGSAPHAGFGAAYIARRWCHGLATELAAGHALSAALWARVTEAATADLGRLAAQLGEPAFVLADALVATVVVGAYARGSVGVFAIGDGAYGDHAAVHRLGPFPDNAPPYPAYACLGLAAPSHVSVQVAGDQGALWIATDGALPLPDEDLHALATDPRWVQHPDALRRRLVSWTETPERIDWQAGRRLISPAATHDDLAVGIIRWAANEGEAV